MKTRIGTKISFDAAHKLPENPIYGKCSQLHGHRYELTIEVEGVVSQYGWICNFSELKKILQKQVVDKYDHSNLNDYFSVPTVENVALAIFSDIQEVLLHTSYGLRRISLYETGNSYCCVEV